MPILQNLRLYLDETGDHSSIDEHDISMRYLGIAGIIFERAEYENFAKALDDFKRKHLPYDPDDPPILHRKEIVLARGNFRVLKDPDRRKAFDEDLLNLIAGADFRIVMVVLDKLDHWAKTYRSLKHPYHYCLLAMLERYCGWLQFISRRGDVLAESRGGREDLSLKEAYRSIYGTGADYLPSERCEATLTSKEIKIKPKVMNIAGLQVADFLAYPLTRDILRRHARISEYESPFQTAIIEIAEKRYNRQVYQNRIDGYGRIFLS
jgi:Protein of unknown function (DUF3800)